MGPDADPRLRLGTVQAAWFGSIYPLGAAAGGLGAMLLNDLIGRKLSIMMSALPSSIGSVSRHAAIGLWWKEDSLVLLKYLTITLLYFIPLYPTLSYFLPFATIT